MQVRMLTGLAGVDFALSPGEIHECSATEAARLIEAGFAELVREKATERAVAPPRKERAAK